MSTATETAVAKAYAWAHKTSPQESLNPIWTSEMSSALPPFVDEENPVAYYHYFHVFGFDWWVLAAKTLDDGDGLDAR